MFSYELKKYYALLGIEKYGINFLLYHLLEQEWISHFSNCFNEYLGIFFLCNTSFSENNLSDFKPKFYELSDTIYTSFTIFLLSFTENLVNVRIWFMMQF